MGNWDRFYESKRVERRKKHLDWELVKTAKGFNKVAFNFYSGEVKKLLDKVFLQYKRNGLTKDDIVDILYKDGFIKADIERQLSGKISIQGYDLLAYLKALKSDNNGNVNLDFYNTRIEKDRLIVERQLPPQIYINMAVDNPMDFELNLKPLKRTLTNEKKVFSLVKGMLKTYFDTPEKSRFLNSKKFSSKLKLQIHQYKNS